ncbi:tetraspanin-3-like [Ruditapes philippinarum]|uniref:tetraspanin-3-like n=1 Tax=Ruditapes philippinarum TaxID=129788 RepID=UPI00295A81D6|nr:tetraspanin-3-like [Ruditapes philippinarum]
MRKRAPGRTLKTFLAFFNVIFWFAGVGFLGLGIWLYLTLHDFRAALDHAHFVLPAYLLIISGGAVVIFGVIGCLAIFAENRCLLAFYWFCIICVLAADVATCVKSFLLNDEVESHVRYRLNVTSSYKYMYDEDITEAIDNLQKTYECCGVRNHSDWSGTAYNIRARSLVARGYHAYPSSCCKHNNCSLDLSNSPEIYSQGCLHPVVNKLSFILVLVGWSTLAISAYLIIESFMVCCYRVAVPR